jgi:hypothetical protein
MRLHAALSQAWLRFWFSPEPAARLGIGRLIFFTLLAFFYLPRDFSAWGAVSVAYWQPIWLFRWLHLPMFSPDAISTLQVIWKIALFGAAAGVITRVSTTVVAVLGTYLLGLGHNFGQVYHFDAILVIAFWILAFSRAGDACSIDAWRRGPAAASAEYRWPVQLILATQALVFFAAGVAKLWASGADWFLSDHLALLLQRVQYHISDADPLVPWGSFIASRPWLYHGMALTTVVVETAYPLALFSRRLRAPIVVAGMALVIGIRALMGPTFEHFLFINVFWVPWDRFARILDAGRAHRAAPPVSVQET